jgi:hypothetical protein
LVVDAEVFDIVRHDTAAAIMEATAARFRHARRSDK